MVNAPNGMKIIIFNITTVSTCLKSSYCNSCFTICCGTLVPFFFSMSFLVSCLSKDFTEVIIIHNKNILKKLIESLGNKDFIRTILERTTDRLDENMFNLRGQIKANNSYNFMHYACIWGRLELCKYLVDSPKMIVDPAVDVSQIDPKSLNSPLYSKTLGSILLRTKTRGGETPKNLAKRYEHHDLVAYLNYAGKLCPLKFLWHLYFYKKIRK